MSATGSTQTQAGPATSVPTSTTAYSPTTGDVVAKPTTTFPRPPSRRSSSCS